MTIRTALFLLLAILWAGPALASPPPHHDLTLTLDPAEGRMTVVDRVRLVSGGSLPVVLAPGLELTGLTVDGKRRAPSRSVDLGERGEHEVVFSYTGSLAPIPEGRRAMAFSPDRPVGREDGIYLPAGSWWMPRLPAASFTYRISIAIPDPWKAVTIGRLVSETMEGGSYHATYESETPQDAIPLMAGPWVVEERHHGNILLRTWFDPESASEAADYLRLTADYIDLYAEWIGDYPFSAFHIVSAPLPVGFGFPGLTYIGARVLKLPFIRHTSLGHEILHNWWGNGVYVDYETGNWCEGLTTFMADYTYALRKGPEAGRTKRIEWLRDFAALPPERDRPVRAFVAKAHDAAQVVGYNKVAFLFHMLRDTVGEKVFDAGLRRFWMEKKFQTASWDDLRAAFEAASGRDLGSFFTQWLERTGAPTLGLETVEAKDNSVSFTLTQDNPPYVLDVPVSVDGHRHTVRLENREQRFNLALDGRPGNLRIDADADLFRRLHAEESPPILRDLTLNPETVVVAADETGSRLAMRMMDTQPRFGRAVPGKPLLVIGPPGMAEKAGLGPAPEEVAGKGTARVWTGRQDGLPFAVVEADDGDALLALLRPLPHYLKRGYMVFEGRKAVVKGNWPPGAGPLSADLH